MKKCLITGGCEISNTKWLQNISKQYDYIIAADSAIGDFDSLGYVPDDVKIIKLKVEKDDTDIMSSVRYALSNGAKEIALIGGIGGRLDHTVANIQTLGFIAENKAIGVLIDENNEVRGLLPGEYEFKRIEGYSLSVFSLTEKVTGLYESGVKYPLENAVLTNKFPLGVSNEIIDDKAVISFDKGILLVCFSKL